MTALLNPRWARCLLPRAVVVIGTVSIAILFSTLGANGQGSQSSPQRNVTLRPLSGAFAEALGRPSYEAAGSDFALVAEAGGASRRLAPNPLWLDFEAAIADTVVASWPKVFGTTTLGALAGHAVSWEILDCAFDERRSWCGNVWSKDMLMVPMVLTPVVSVGGAAMLAGSDFWRSLGGTTLGILGSGLVYVLGFASDLPHPAIVGLAGLTHAGITTLVVIR